MNKLKKYGIIEIIILVSLEALYVGILVYVLFNPKRPVFNIFQGISLLIIVLSLLLGFILLDREIEKLEKIEGITQ